MSVYIGNVQLCDYERENLLANDEVDSSSVLKIFNMYIFGMWLFFLFFGSHQSIIKAARSKVWNLNIAHPRRAPHLEFSFRASEGDMDSRLFLDSWQVDLAYH